MLRVFIYAVSILALMLVASAAGLYVYLANLEGKRADGNKYFLGQRQKPLLAAHRGGGGEAPENTLEAFRNAQKMGMDHLELDVHATKDGELVVIHDSTVDRTTNGSGKVSDMTLAELRSLDAGHDFTKDGGQTFPFRSTGVRIPKLTEVFEAFPFSLINIEIKHTERSSSRYLCGLLEEHGRKRSVIVASVSDDVIEEFRSDCPGVATSASFWESISFYALFKLGLAENFYADMEALQIPSSFVGTGEKAKAFIEAAQERNLEIHVWTVNSEERIREYLRLGVDGIMTDYPKRLRAEAN